MNLTLISALHNFKQAFDILAEAWEKDNNSNDLCPDRYPFDESFDVVKDNVADWVEDITLDIKLFDCHIDAKPVKTKVVIECPVCGQNDNVRKDYDYPTHILCCEACGADFSEDNTVILNPNNIK